MEEKKHIKIQSEIQDAYFSYAYSTITERSLPSVFDGLKPVHRRVLYGHWVSGHKYNEKHKKSSHIVGIVMGQFHPHGDASIYDTLVRMGQDFIMREPLIDIQGNYGSIDGDPAAAMRYTEARLTKIAHEFFYHDIDYDTVDFTDNYDNTKKEPEVLPVRFPNLLINGSQGIAVGISTSIPPHNLKETIDALLYLLDNPEADLEELMNFIKGPDFPTGGIITNSEVLKNAYNGLESTVHIKSKYHIDGNDIIITEIPYLTKKGDLLEKLSLVMREKKIDGINFIRDESDMHGISVRIQVRKDQDPHVIMNQIFKYTPFMNFVRMSFFALDKNGRPKLFTLKEILENFIYFRDLIVMRRSNFKLKEAVKKIHYHIGDSIAFDNLDFIINTIKNNEDPIQIFKNTKFKCTSLQDCFEVLGFEKITEYSLSDEQIKHILDLRLNNLKKIEINKVKENLINTTKDVSDLVDIINNQERRKNIIREELNNLKEFFSERKTEISCEAHNDINLIQPEDVLVAIDENNCIQRILLHAYKTQNRGGKGRLGHKFTHNVISNTINYLLLFVGNLVYRVYTYKVPIGSIGASGRSLVNVIDVNPNQKVDALLSIGSDFDGYILIIFKNGKVRKNPISVFSNINRNGKIYRQEEEEIFGVLTARKDENLIIATKKGLACRIPVEKFSIINSRTSVGVKGIELAPGDEIISAITDNNAFILTITANGFGKKCTPEEYRLTNRGTKGVINIKNINKTGHIVVVLPVSTDEDILLFSNSGNSIRLPVDQIRTVGRSSTGVKLWDLKGDDKVLSVESVPKHS